MKKKILLPLLAALLISGVSFAQKGNNVLQASGQLSLPTNSLENSVKTGFGFAVKGMYGISTKQQHLTLEAGYNNFAFKNFPEEIDAKFLAIPVNAGYRYTTGHFALEPQIGISVNRVGVSYAGESGNETETNFAWAGGISYMFNKIELGIKYQVTYLGDSDAITFGGIRLGYNFSL